MLRRENGKDLGVSRRENHPLLLFKIHVKERVVMQTPNRQTLSFKRKFFQSLAQIFSELSN